MSSEIKSTTVQTNSLKDKTGTRTLASDSGSAWSWGTGVPSDTIIQIEQTVKTTVTNRTNTSASIDWADISGMTCNITPQTGNKVFVIVSANFSSGSGYNNNCRLLRGSTPICVGTDSHSSQASASFFWRVANTTHMCNMSLNFLDNSPGGDGSTAITYKLQWTGENGGTMYLNQNALDNDAYTYSHQASSITLMEIAG